MLDLRPVLRCGRYQDVLADVQADHVIADPPYGSRTHAGQGAAGRDPRRRTSGRALLVDTGLAYTHWTHREIHEFVRFWHERTRGWICALTSHDLVPHWQKAFRRVGRYGFAPVTAIGTDPDGLVPIPCVQTGMNVRLAGDGPSSWTVYLMVARPRATLWRSLNGAYIGTANDAGQNTRRRVVAGGKPLWMMRSIVRDYSDPGDLIVDPCAGGASTLIAAALESRRSIGAEMDPSTFERAQRELARGVTPDMLASRAEHAAWRDGLAARPEQGSIFTG